MRLTAVLLIIFLGSCAQKKDENISKEQLNHISQENLKKHLAYIASDEMKGRETGSPELKIVANYLAENLKSYGYQGMMPGGSFLQKLSIYQNEYDFSTLTTAYKKPLNVKINEDIVVYNRSKYELNVNTPIYFVGQGVYNDSIKQFDASNVKGNVILRYLLTEDLKKQSKKYTDRTISQFLIDSLGAKIVIHLINDSENDLAVFNTYKHYAKRSSMTIRKNGEEGTLILLKTSAAKPLIRELDSEKAKMLSANFSLSLKNKGDALETQNVVAVLEGTDETLKHEYVAYSSHYDHVGIKDGEIYNGADDDGSGTVAVLEIARVLALNPPKRSTAIIFHTAEEKGLLGSKYYSENQIIKMDDFVALFNMDMVGRSADSIVQNDETRLTLKDEIYVIGAEKISTELYDISEAANNTYVNWKLNYYLSDESHPARIYYRSDHWNYAKYGVPIIFYFDGIHEDYHKPTDTIEKIDFNKIEKVSKLALSTGYRVANQTTRIKRDKL